MLIYSLRGLQYHKRKSRVIINRLQVHLHDAYVHKTVHVTECMVAATADMPAANRCWFRLHSRRVGGRGGRAGGQRPGAGVHAATAFAGGCMRCRAQKLRRRR